MTSRRGIRFLILCEDRQQEVFVRRFLLGTGAVPREIRVAKYTSGAGAAEQRVREQYSHEICAHRRKAANQRVGLVVVMDADTHSVASRHKQLASQIKAENFPARGEQERIVVLVPKWNIETWIHFLLGKTVDENTAYPKFARESDCQPAVDKLVTICSSHRLPPDAPPSLGVGVQELARL